MPIPEFVSIILLMCGTAGGDVNLDCVDYYNNCVINKSATIKLKNIHLCKDAYVNNAQHIKKQND